MYIEKLDEVVNKLNSIYRRTIKMKPFDVKPTIYIDFNKTITDKGPKFKTTDNVRISKYKIIFEKGYAPGSFEKVLVIKKVKNNFRGGLLLVILKVKKLLEHLTKQNSKKSNEKEGVKKVIKRKCMLNYMLNRTIC